MGRTGGVAVRLARDVPALWLLVVHCVGHRFELAIKDAFEVTGADVWAEELWVIYLPY